MERPHKGVEEWGGVLVGTALVGGRFEKLGGMMESPLTILQHRHSFWYRQRVSRLGHSREDFSSLGSLDQSPVTTLAANDCTRSILEMCVF